MKKLIAPLLLALGMHHSYGANIITLTGSNTYTVATNEVAEVITVGQVSSAESSFLLNGSAVRTIKFPIGGTSMISLLPMAIAGPSNTIGAQETTGIGGNTNSFVTLRIRTKAEYLASFTLPSPAVSSSVVIPEDASGPVTIVMESSTDLVSWVAANPGAYGASTPRRFFRVRAIQN
jgi:hypothetical protein